MGSQDFEHRPTASSRDACDVGSANPAQIDAVKFGAAAKKQQRSGVGSGYGVAEMCALAKRIFESDVVGRFDDGVFAAANWCRCRLLRKLMRMLLSAARERWLERRIRVSVAR